MIRRITKFIVGLIFVVLVAGCHHNKVNNPIANVDSKQPDKVLFDRAMDAMKKGKYDVARITLQTLINTYPDSEFIARAKLAVGDSWYAEGTTASYQQAEVEYKDFITFFPQLPEAAEAQLKIANMHYKQMEKPDRDQQKTREALDKFNDMINSYPRSALTPQAVKRRQDVLDRLAKHDHIVARYYIKRHSWNAAVSRLNSVVERYPDYADRAGVFYDLGNSLSGLGRKAEARLYYERVISEFPKSDYAGHAKRKLDQLKA